MNLIFRKRSDKKGSIPGVLYGPGLENVSFEIDAKELEEVYKEAGESSLVSLESEDGKEKYSVLIHEMQKDPLTGKIVHIDFYQPNLKEEVEVSVPLIFEGVAPAVKDLGGTLVKNISEIEVKSLPAKLPHNIKVDVSVLATFEDLIKVEDLVVPADVKIVKSPDEIVALVTPVEKAEEEMEKPTEDTESVEVAKKERKEAEEKEEQEQ